MKKIFCSSKSRKSVLTLAACVHPQPSFQACRSALEQGGTPTHSFPRAPLGHSHQVQL